MVAEGILNLDASSLTSWHREGSVISFVLLCVLLIIGRKMAFR